MLNDHLKFFNATLAPWLAAPGSPIAVVDRRPQMAWINMIQAQFFLLSVSYLPPTNPQTFSYILTFSLQEIHSTSI